MKFMKQSPEASIGRENIWVRHFHMRCQLVNGMLIYKRILMVSSRSSRSHSMLRRLVLSSFDVHSNSSFAPYEVLSSKSRHLWYSPFAVCTAFWTSLVKWRDLISDYNHYMMFYIPTFIQISRTILVSLDSTKITSTNLAWLPTY